MLTANAVSKGSAKRKRQHAACPVWEQAAFFFVTLKPAIAITERQPSFANSPSLISLFLGPDSAGSPWAWGWEDWLVSPANTNILFLRDPRWSKLAPYISAERNLHKCPNDRYLSKAQKMKGWKERVRTYVMNGTIGNGNAQTGPWDPLYRQAKTEAQLTFPGPSESSVFLEEHSDSINDPFFFPPLRASWIDIPATFHPGATSFSFGDGHAEIHSWAGVTRNWPITTTIFRTPNTRAGDPDMHYLSYHSQRASSRSY